MPYRRQSSVGVIFRLRVQLAAMVKKLKNGKAPIFDAQAFLDSAGVARKILEFPKKATVFAQGDPAKTVMYIQQGGVTLPSGGAMSITDANRKQFLLSCFSSGREA